MWVKISYIYHLSSFKLHNWGHSRRGRKSTKIVNTSIFQLLGITIFSLIHVGYLTLIKCRMFFFGFKQRFVISMRKTNFAYLVYFQPSEQTLQIWQYQKFLQFCQSILLIVFVHCTLELIKVKIFWESHKNLAHLPLSIWRYDIT